MRELREFTSWVTDPSQRARRRGSRTASSASHHSIAVSRGEGDHVAVEFAHGRGGVVDVGEVEYAPSMIAVPAQQFARLRPPLAEPRGEAVAPARVPGRPGQLAFGL